MSDATRLAAVQAVADRWDDVLRGAKEDNPRWIVDSSITNFESCLTELRRALKTP